MNKHYQRLKQSRHKQYYGDKAVICAQYGIMKLASLMHAENEPSEKSCIIPYSI